MKKKQWWMGALLAVSVAISTATSIMAHPEVFATQTLEQAKETAKSKHKLLLIDFTASWCGPCKLMDQTTWSDAKVVDWLNKNAVAIQIDVDKQKAIAQELSVQAMPTIVLYSADNQGSVFDRKKGYQTPDVLLAWLEDVKAGKSSASSLEESMKPFFGKGGREEVQARYKIAGSLAERGDYKRATEQYVWLWKNIPTEDPEMGGVRGSFMAAQMARIAKQDADSKKQFETLRIEAEKLDDRSDWIVLNEVLNDYDATLAWFDSVKEKPSSQATLEALEHRLEKPLINHQRWSDMGLYIFKDPMKKLKDQFAFSQEIAEFEKSRGSRQTHNMFRGTAATLYASLLAAGRNEDAAKALVEILKLDPSLQMRVALVVTCKKANQLKAPQLSIIDDLGPNFTKDDDFYKTRAQIYWELKQLDLALKDADEIIKRDPSNAQNIFNRSQIFFEQKRIDKALVDLNKAIELDPKFEKAYVSRAYMHTKLKNDTAALADLELAKKLDPEDPYNYVNKSALLYRQKKFDLAYDAANEALKLAPDNGNANCNRGEAALRLGKYDSAVTDLTKGIASDPDLAGEGKYYRALAYEKLGKSDLAKVDKEESQKAGFTPDPGE